MEKKKVKRNLDLSSKLGYVLLFTIVITIVVVTESRRAEIGQQNVELMENLKYMDSTYLNQKDKLYDQLGYIEKELTQTKNELEKAKEKLSHNNRRLISDIERYISVYYKRVPTILRKNIADTIVNKSSEYNISPSLIVGIIEVESSFDPLAVSSKNARGLMQVMPEWVEKCGVDSVYDLHEIDINIDCGIRIFLIHFDEEDNNLDKALYKYVGGDKNYVTRVLVSAGKFSSFCSEFATNE